MARRIWDDYPQYARLGTVHQIFGTKATTVSRRTAVDIQEKAANSL